MNIKLKKIFSMFILIYGIIGILFFLIVNKQLSYTPVEGISVNNPKKIIGQLLKGDSVTQSFICKTDTIDSISIMFGTYGKTNTGALNIKILDANSNTSLHEQNIDVSNLVDNSFQDIHLNTSIKNIKGMLIDIEITSLDGRDSNSVTIWYNDENIMAGEELIINSNKIQGELCFKINGSNKNGFSKNYFIFIIVLGILFSIYYLYLKNIQKKGKSNFVLNTIFSFIRYKFLLGQLISRDFKTKYKRSVLGVIWSFLNPLLTMSVQYIVFSTIFKSDIQNFPVYLLTGIVSFNFFSEATGMALISIVGNAALITKVYVPKYIYPISKVLSSTINLLLSMIPLLLMVAITDTHINATILLLPFVVICLIVFSIGIGFILSSIMVFFRDTQFLWNVIIMLWMYMTPIFYPENIIPQKFIQLYRLNPIYHYLRFSRTIIMEGISPQPLEYLICIAFSISAFAIGTFIFKKTQDKFIVNI